MPVTNTITSTDYFTAAAGLTLTSSNWNSHMAIWRGHLLPVDGSSSAAANNSYDLGSSTYNWKDAYVAGKIFQTVAYTSGAFSFGSQHMVRCDASGGGFTVTLPSAANFSGATIAIKKVDSGFNLITLATSDGIQTIDSTTTTTLATENECLYLISDGVNWQKKNRYIDGKINLWTPTGTWSTNVTFAGTWKRDGKYAECDVQIKVSGAVTTGSLYIGPPSGLTIDTSVYVDYTITSPIVVGKASLTDTGVVLYTGVSAMYNTTGGVFISSVGVAASYALLAGTYSSVPHTYASGDFVEATFRIPITNWEA